MGPGFRYHVATIAAIFFALTVGLVVGSLYVSPQLADGQRKAILALRETLNREIATQKEQIKQYEEFVAQTTPSLLRGRLSGVSVAVVVTGDYPEALASVRDALKLAEARILSVTKIERGLNRPNEVLNPILANLHTEDNRIPTDREGLARLLASLITRRTATLNDLLPLLIRENLIDVEPNADFKTEARYVVLVSGTRSEVSNRVAYVDKPLIIAFQRLGVTVIACEPEATTVSDAEQYRSLNLDLRAIRNVDKEMGRCALILAVRGDRPESDEKDKNRAARTDLPESFRSSNTP